MKKISALLRVCACLRGVIGCQGETSTWSERQDRYDRIVEDDFKQFADDWDYFWLMDKNSRLNEWAGNRIGS